MALNANNDGSDVVRRIKPPPAPRAHTTGAQNSQYSLRTAPEPNQRTLKPEGPVSPRCG